MDFSSQSDQLRRKLRVWSHLLEKSSMKNFIFLCCAKNKLSLVTNQEVKQLHGEIPKLAK